MTAASQRGRIRSSASTSGNQQVSEKSAENERYDRRPGRSAQPQRAAHDDTEEYDTPNRLRRDGA